MATEYIKLGQRIGYLRRKAGMSQDDIADKTGLSREFISRVETGKMGFAIDVLIQIANALDVSADDILVDYLNHSASTADSELHQLLLDCSREEEYILTETIKALKAILSSRGI